VGGGVTAAVLVRNGRNQLAPRRVRVLHILLEAVRAQPSAGPSAETGPRPHRPDIPPGRPKQLPLQFLVTAQPSGRRHLQQCSHAQHFTVGAEHEQQLVPAVAVR